MIAVSASGLSDFATLLALLGQSEVHHLEEEGSVLVLTSAPWVVTLDNVHNLQLLVTLVAHDLVVLDTHCSLSVSREFELCDFEAHIADEVHFVIVLAEHVPVVNDLDRGLLIFDIDIRPLAGQSKFFTNLVALLVDILASIESKDTFLPQVCSLLEN